MSYTTPSPPKTPTQQYQQYRQPTPVYQQQQQQTEHSEQQYWYPPQEQSGYSEQQTEYSPQQYTPNYYQRTQQQSQGYSNKTQEGYYSPPLAQYSTQNLDDAVTKEYNKTTESFDSEPDIDPTLTKDGDGWQFRPTYIGHIITRGEVIARVVPFYEMFATNVFLLGYKVLDNAKQAVVSSTYRVILFEACTDRWKIEDFDFCAASRLIIGLIGGAIIYFIITALFAIAIGIELKRKGFHSTFTALWHSPLFFLCYLFPERKRVDILSIPNKYVKLSLWTRSHVQRFAMALYCFVCMVLVFYSLKRGTVESAKIRGEKLDQNTLKKYYNPYLIPYYVALYIFFKTMFGMVVDIFQDKHNRNQPERLGRYYKSIKSD